MKRNHDKQARKVDNLSRKVLIIGATSGIGRALARVFVYHGYKVAASGRRNDLLLSLQQTNPQKIVTECFDVCGNENIIHLRNMIEKLDGLDIMVYCSGFGEVTTGLQWDIEKQTTEVNVNAFIEMVCYGFNYFLNQGTGQIACISSVGSIRGNAYAPAYNAAKAFQSNYMEGLYFKAKKLMSNISITDIQPGFVDTAMAKGAAKFWVASPEKAAQQIFSAIIKKKKVAYITKRWWFFGVLFKHLPDFIYARLGRYL